MPLRKGVKRVSPQQEQRVERRLAAIFAADVAGYSRLMSQNEAATLRALAAARDIMDGLIAAHGGRIANTAGDSVLAEFPSAVDAVQCALAVQEKLAKAGTGEAQDRRLQFRIGVHVGDVVVRGADLLGEGVNVAARLEGRKAGWHRDLPARSSLPWEQISQSAPLRPCVLGLFFRLSA